MAKLNVAEYAIGVKSLGPGNRICLWVQGCLGKCPECISPEWGELKPAKVVESHKLADHFLAAKAINGLTMSGGEPMLQAKSLVDLWEYIKIRQSSWNLIVFSGMTQAQILAENNPDRVQLMKQADAFIGGPYVKDLNDGFGLRGSSNQEIVFRNNSIFTTQEKVQILKSPRKLEFWIESEQYLMIGIPSPSNKYQIKF